MRILLVEDDVRLRETLSGVLMREGFAVDTAHSLQTARSFIDRHDYEILVIDRRLPDGDGIELCRIARQAGKDPVILSLTAMDEEEAVVEGLDAGADDYLAKPFELSVLLARLRALSRRRSSRPLLPLSVGNLQLSPGRRSARVGSSELALTGREYAILELLVSRHPATVSRSEIIEYAWGERQEPWSNTVDVLVGRLRRKLSTAAGAPRIATHRGTGYVLQ